VPNNALFIDTWGWTAIANRDEPRRDEVLRYYRETRKKQIRIYTSDYVLDEFITLLFRRETYSHATQFVEDLLATATGGLPIVERVTTERFLAAWELRKRYQDKPRISFTDLTSMVIMTELGVEQVLTEDEHFTHVGLGLTKVP